jgi:hypothetical protein
MLDTGSPRVTEPTKGSLLSPVPVVSEADIGDRLSGTTCAKDDKSRLAAAPCLEVVYPVLGSFRSSAFDKKSHVALSSLLPGPYVQGILNCSQRSQGEPPVHLAFCPLQLIHALLTRFGPRGFGLVTLEISTLRSDLSGDVMNLRTRVTLSLRETPSEAFRRMLQSFRKVALPPKRLLCA